jgi:hypothetical protein
LLHDFGEVGVREEVLVKAKKLYPLHFVRVLDRLDYIRRDIAARIAEQKVEALLSLSRKQAAERHACSTRNRAGCAANWIDLRNSSPRLTSRRFFLRVISNC